MGFTERAFRTIQRTKTNFPAVTLFEFEDRNRKLRKEGFLPWERFWLAQHAIDTPGVEYMRKERVKMVKQFDITFDNYNEWQQHISKWYKAHDWDFKDGRLNPFKMLEWYKDKANQPDTPQPKQAVKVKDFAAAKEKTVARGEKPSKKTGYAARYEEKRGR